MINTSLFNMKCMLYDLKSEKPFSYKDRKILTLSTYIPL